MRWDARQKGFTLIEVLIALSILAVGILAVAALQGQALRAAAGAELSGRARAAAASQAEGLLALPDDHPHLRDRNGNGRAGLDDREADPQGADHCLPPEGPQGLQVCWNVAENDPAPGLISLRVAARWGPTGDKGLALDLVRTGRD
ncbi:type IV pilus modification PilV family protein [Geoalkalibacter sp.]|uniref:type IV pilus modification PilV family protein n=1 Tax=Geoalkalibacter sp. TaxID=3041440 RepID=UPI00272E66FC|nr:prepilin-type N-terminal cleavage/methylation domain-containing protein [Geoalkalibacter sp.]